MKKYQWFFFSGIVFSLLAAQQLLADETPLKAERPGQAETKQKRVAAQPNQMRPANGTNANAVKGKFRITSHPTGEAEERNFVGIVTEPIPAALAAQLNSMMKAGQGVGVKLVLPDSPAQQAGIKIFDVLTTFNGKAITSSDALRKFVMDSPKGSKIKLGVIRASQHQLIEVTLTEKLFRFHKFSVSPVGQNSAQASNPQKKIPSQPKPKQEGPIATRSTDSDPLGRKLPLGFSHLPVTSTQNLSLLYIGNLKKGYSVEVSYQDVNDTLQTQKFKGNLKEIRNQVVDMPDHVQMMINERLRELKLALQGNPPFRFQMKGHLQGNARFIRVFLSRGTKDKSVRMVELDHHLGNRPALNVNQILGNQVFTQELNQLNPTIQQQIKVTLQRVRIPTAQVRVDNPI
ncbi:PDZ domain-containing protein [Gimesia fumaroli]|jgi:hypothetical protein|uniref:Periplasmic serine endoprotease DegP n=1 Tax=Gimesia fumaroli TaxID=2527976 RepID=A0A518IID2_9PLAN|nr:PDZ domain-containing protein [Gimesia fumaroli]QDV52800.1 Periplasmic serine endoprotease DegP precursor [Gimesia fumaroli]